MVYDRVRGVSVLFGGCDANLTAMGDTWQWNGIAWTQAQVSSPGPRYDSTMSFDDVRGVAVLFGGRQSNSMLGDTWEWDGSNWVQRSPVAGPTARHGHMSAFGSRGRTLMHGGHDGQMYFEDTWEWDGSAWSQVASEGPGGGFGTMVHDSLRQRTVQFGGIGGRHSFGDGTWEWSNLPGIPAIGAVYGHGCGIPLLSLTQLARPALNKTAQARLDNIPSTIAFMSLGWSRSTLWLFPLPLPLAGMPGCQLWQSAEVPALSVSMSGGGGGVFQLPLPNLTSLAGTHVYLQGWAFAPGVNPTQAVISNGLDWRIGY